MKKLLTLLALAFIYAAQAQNLPPQAINFQGVAIDKNGIPVPGINELGNPIQNAGIKVRFSILEGTATGTSVYREVHETTTDEFGRFNVEIGRGSSQEGQFESIQWGNDRHFLKVEVDLNDPGTNYTLASVQEFLSVPYALYSKSSGSSSDDLDKDDQNEIQTLTLSGDLLSISQGNTVTLPADLDEQQLSISGGVISISNGNSISLPVDSDNQLLTVSGNDLSISNGNTVALPVSPDNQSLSISGNSLSISNGNSVTLPPNTDNQTLAISGNSVSISNGNSITLPTAPDNQTLTLSGSTLSITNGNSVVLPTDADNQSLNITSSGSSRSLGITGGNSVSFTVNDADSSATNELQALSKVGSTISLSNGGGSVLDSDNQSLSLTGNSLSISNGNSIALPVAPDNQTLTLSGSTLSISNGNSITLNINDADSSSSNEIQTLSINGNTISLSNNGGSITLPADQVNDADADSTNELQSLSLTGNVLSLTDGGSVNLSSLAGGNSVIQTFNGYNDTINHVHQRQGNSLLTYYSSIVPPPLAGTYWIISGVHAKTYFSTLGNVTADPYYFVVRLEVNGLQRSLPFTVNSNDQIRIFLTSSGGCCGTSGQDSTAVGISYKSYAYGSFSDEDIDSTNELQTISISNDTIFLSNGGFVKLPSTLIPSSNTSNTITSSQLDDLFGLQYTGNGSLGDFHSSTSTLPTMKFLNYDDFFLMPGDTLNLVAQTNVITPTTTVLFVQDTCYLAGFINGKGSGTSDRNLNFTSTPPFTYKGLQAASGTFNGTNIANYKEGLHTVFWNEWALLKYIDPYQELVSNLQNNNSFIVCASQFGDISGQDGGSYGSAYNAFGGRGGRGLIIIAKTLIINNAIFDLRGGSGTASPNTAYRGGAGGGGSLFISYEYGSIVNPIVNTTGGTAIASPTTIPLTNGANGRFLFHQR
jgi:hypothetical protein